MPERVETGDAMKHHLPTITLLIAVFFIAASNCLQAAPSLPITEPPVTSTYLDGPPVDPGSTNGQWFLDLTGQESSRSREFHDNMSGSGGGNMQSLAIEGKVISVTTNALGQITAFDVYATIYNDTLSTDGQETLGDNSHGETRPAGTEQYIGTLYDTKLTAEFAIVDQSKLPGSFTGPYLDTQPYIIADNEDQYGWYCWNDQDPPNGDEAGSYYVPTWDFGDIRTNQSAGRTLQFSVSSPMDSADPRYGVIMGSLSSENDVFANRTTSLKISTWIDDIGTDFPGPEGMLRDSDVSVFHNIEDEDPPPEYPHKMHWPQLPDPNGWDVRACNRPDGLRKVLADDFRCAESGPITNITFWGSFRHDEYMEQVQFHGITNIHLSLHDDIPDPDGQGPEFSKPALPARWEWDINPYNPPAGWRVTVEQEIIDSSQGWYDPNIPQNTQHPNHMDYFRYEISIPPTNAFVQVVSNIYWLDISVETSWPEWGWKTSGSDHFMDDAVWADLPVQDTNQWNELRDPLEPAISLDLAFVIDGGEEQEELDWGDAPDAPYPTLSTNGGAWHIIGGPWLGDATDSPDSEPDGQPDPNALGDDLDTLYPPPNDDEDGVVIPTLILGQTSNVTIQVNGSAGPSGVDAWIDFNGDGVWSSPSELIFSGYLTNGIYSIAVTPPAGSILGSTFARIRISTAGGLPPTGGAQDGEVEDHQVTIEEPVYLDWGDAPDPTYPTLSASSGANHLLGQGIYLGASVDADLNGQPHLQALGDDTNMLYAGVAYPPGDEDGVIFITPLFPGTVAQVNVIASAPALLNAWIDFNGNGSWTNAGEQVFTDVPLSAGPNPLTFAVPSAAIPGQTFARFRYSTIAGLQPTGYASDGEVEDYLVILEDAPEVDWGDAPDAVQAPYYPTLMTNNGAHHIILPGMFLGGLVDPEPDGQPTPSSDGDDLDILYSSMGDDEDGVILTSLLMPGGYATVDVLASQPGALDAWIDFGNDGSWAQAGDQIFAAQPLTSGVNSLTFPVPTNAAQGNAAYSRFRYSLGGGLPYTGFSMEGEVEDHEFYIQTIEGGIDWGDAPNTYPTLNAGGGARHTITLGVMLGAIVDNEPDGQPTAAANGDDTDFVYTSLGDDEDGVSFTSKIVAGSNATARVVAGALGGKLDAWVDFNADGDWADAGEQIFASQTLSPGVNSLTFTVPAPPLARGTSYARFRISMAGSLPPGGAANGGEVEDYTVNLYQPAPTNLVITNLTFNVSNTVATVEWSAQTGLVYQLQMSTNLLTNVWANIGPLVMGPTNLQTNAVANSNQFYRVEAPSTP